MEGSNIEWTPILLGTGLGVLFSMPIAYLIGILSNVHAIRFMQFRDNRKLLKKAKTKQQALLIFNRIKAFKEGKRDRYPFYIVLGSSSVCCSVLAATLLLCAVIRQDFSFENRLVLALLALMAVVMTIGCLLGIYEHARQIERFEDYRKEFQERWGAE